MSEVPQNPYKLYQIIRGVRFPALKEFKHYADTLDLVSGDGDIIIASYPKTGTTWMQYIVVQIRSKGQFFPSFNHLHFKVSPYVGMTGTEAVNAQGDQKFYKIHLPYDKINKNSKSKYICTYRHPEDTVVSYYKYWDNNNRENPIEFDEFFERFMDGNIGYGNYFEHILPFYEHREDKNLLLVSYEKLHSNTREEILRIAKFLGEEYYQDLMDDGQLLDKILKHIHFDYMKQSLNKGIPDISFKDYGIPPDNFALETDFFRKGVIGDGKLFLSESQRRRLKEAAKEVLKGTSLLKEWYTDEND